MNSKGSVSGQHDTDPFFRFIRRRTPAYAASAPFFVGEAVDKCAELGYNI